jgi:hypothetical protein
VQDVVAQFRRRQIELSVRQLKQQVCVRIVSERVFRSLGRQPTIEVAVGQYKFVVAHLLEKDPVLINGRVDAFEIEILRLGASDY